MIPDLIIIPLAFIIYVLINRCNPDLLKLVKVIPIHSGGLMQDTDNYQPISLLSIFDKIIEKLMQNGYILFLRIIIYYFINNLDLEKITQLYYALVQITEIIKASADSGKFGCGIFIDLRKAFDTVNIIKYYLLSWNICYQRCVILVSIKSK